MTSCCPVYGSVSQKDAGFNTFVAKSGSVCCLRVSSLVVTNSITIPNDDPIDACRTITTNADVGSAITQDCRGEIFTNLQTQNVFETDGAGSTIEVGLRATTCEPTITQWNNVNGTWQFAPPPGATVVTAGGLGMYPSVAAAIAASPCAPFVRVAGDLIGVDTNVSLNAAISAAATAAVIIYVDPGRRWAPTLNAPIDMGTRSLMIQGAGTSSVVSFAGGLAGVQSVDNAAGGLTIENVSLETNGPVNNPQQLTRIRHTTVILPSIGPCFIGSTIASQIDDTVLSDIILQAAPGGTIAPVIVGTATGASQGLHMNNLWVRGNIIGGPGIDIVGSNVQMNNIIITGACDITLTGGGMLNGITAHPPISTCNVILNGTAFPGNLTSISNAQLSTLRLTGLIPTQRFQFMVNNIVLRNAGQVALTLDCGNANISNVFILQGRVETATLLNSVKVTNLLASDGFQANIWNAGGTGLANQWNNIQVVTPGNLVGALLIQGNGFKINNFHSFQANITINGSNNAGISNLTTNTNLVLIIQNCNNCAFVNVFVFGGAAGLQLQGSSSLMFSSCVFGTVSTLPIGGPAPNPANVVNVTFAACTMSGAVSITMGNGTFTGCQILNNLTITSGDVYQITNCTIGAITQVTNLQVWPQRGARFTGNRFANTVTFTDCNNWYMNNCLIESDLLIGGTGGQDVAINNVRLYSRNQPGTVGSLTSTVGHINSIFSNIVADGSVTFSGALSRVTFSNIILKPFVVPSNVLVGDFILSSAGNTNLTIQGITLYKNVNIQANRSNISGIIVDGTSGFSATTNIQGTFNSISQISIFPSNTLVVGGTNQSITFLGDNNNISNITVTGTNAVLPLLFQRFDINGLRNTVSNVTLGSETAGTAFGYGAATDNAIFLRGPQSSYTNVHVVMRPNTAVGFGLTTLGSAPDLLIRFENCTFFSNDTYISNPNVIVLADRCTLSNCTFGNTAIAGPAIGGPDFTAASVVVVYLINCLVKNAAFPGNAKVAVATTFVGY